MAVQKNNTRAHKGSKSMMSIASKQASSKTKGTKANSMGMRKGRKASR